jgi:hypothetical protein
MVVEAEAVAEAGDADPTRITDLVAVVEAGIVEPVVAEATEVVEAAGWTIDALYECTMQEGCRSDRHR